MIINGKFGNLVHKTKILTVDFLQLLSLEKIYKEGSRKEDELVDTTNDKGIMIHDKIKSFQDETSFK